MFEPVTSSDGPRRTPFGTQLATRGWRTPRAKSPTPAVSSGAHQESAEPLRPRSQQRHCPGEEPFLPQGKDVDVLPDRFVADPRAAEGRDRRGDLVQGRELRSNRLLLGFELRELLFDQPLPCSEQLLERDQTRQRSGDLSQRRIVRDAVDCESDAGQQEPELRPGSERSQRGERSQRQGAVDETRERQRRDCRIEQAHEHALRSVRERSEPQLQILAERRRLLQRAHRLRSALQGWHVVRRSPEPGVKGLLSWLGQRAIDLDEECVHFQVVPGGVIQPEPVRRSETGSNRLEVAPAAPPPKKDQPRRCT